MQETETRGFKLSKGWVIGIIIATVVVGLYWFAIRPDQVRHGCVAKSTAYANNNPTQAETFLGHQESDLWYSRYQMAYNLCLQEAGLPSQ